MKKKKARNKVLPPIRVTEEELANAKLKASVYGFSLSEWVRHCLKNYRGKKRGPS